MMILSFLLNQQTYLPLGTTPNIAIYYSVFGIEVLIVLVEFLHL